jgi:hypothetical protein
MPCNVDYPLRRVWFIRIILFKQSLNAAGFAATFPD